VDLNDCIKNGLKSSYFVLLDPEKSPGNIEQIRAKGHSNVDG
jgi:hypothetical protein